MISSAKIPVRITKIKVSTTKILVKESVLVAMVLKSSNIIVI